MKPPGLKLKKTDFPDQKDWIDKLLRPLANFASETQNAMTQGLTFAENISSEQLTFETILWDGHHEVTLNQPWGPVALHPNNYQPPKWRKLDNGLVVLSGVCGGGQFNTPAFSLPETCWPTNDLSIQITAAFENLFTAYEMRIEANGGAVVPGFGAGGLCDLAYTQAVFEAADLTPDVNPVFPLSQRTTLANPIGVVPMRVIELASNLDERPVSKALSVDWSVQNDTFVIHDIAGLQPGKRYRITLLIYGG